jgi:membrane protein
MASHASTKTNSGPETGRDAETPLEMPTLGWKQVALRTWKQSSEDNVALIAAGVAFYSFLALVPLLGAIVLTYGIVADPQTVLGNVKSLTSIMPADAAKLIGNQLMSVVQTSGSKKGLGLLLAIGVAIFGARNAAGSLITALNIAYEQEEKRGFIRVNLLALGMTVGAVLLAVLAISATAALGYLSHIFPSISGVLAGMARVLSFAVLLMGAAAAAATLYRYGPDRDRAKWAWITPGTIFAAITWLILTLGFGLYVSHFGNYNKTYGSLATIVILVTWIWLSAYLFLFGAELNSELEHQTERDTTEGVERPLGARGAWSADHVASSDEPQKASGGDVSPPNAAEAQRERNTVPAEEPAASSSPALHYVAARVTNRAERFAGLQKVGMFSSAIATTGLALLRKKGRVPAGMALLATAVGFALLKRED